MRVTSFIDMASDIDSGDAADPSPGTIARRNPLWASVAAKAPRPSYPPGMDRDSPEPPAASTPKSSSLISKADLL
jgi:hypothetical protein